MASRLIFSEKYGCLSWMASVRTPDSSEVSVTRSNVGSIGDPRRRYQPKNSVVELERWLVSMGALGMLYHGDISASIGGPGILDYCSFVCQLPWPISDQY